ncbi:t-SNARE affecting a late Golgi compartment protein 2 [Cryptotrichosporon argae]
MANPYIPAASSSTYTPPSPAPTKLHPVTRSRTLFYLSVRDTSSFASSSSRRPTRAYGVDEDDEDEHQGLMRGAAVGVDMKGLPPKWVDVSDEVEDVLGRLNGKIAALDKLHAKHVLPGFTDRTAEEREIEQRTTDITRDFRRCTTLISTIQPGRGSARVELVTAKNVQRGLAQKVQDLSGVFRKKQRVYMQKLQGHAIKNKDLLAASGAISLRGSELDELAEDEAATQALQQESLSAVPDVDLARRTAEISQIASSIAELAELFRDLGNMVVEQGTVLDSVEWNIAATAREMEGAVAELKVAQRYQANTGRRRCILLLVLIIVGLVIVLIYKPRNHSHTGQAGSAAGSGVISDNVDIVSGTSSAAFVPSASTRTRHSHTSTRRVRPARPTRTAMARPPPLEDVQ